MAGKHQRGSIFDESRTSTAKANENYIGRHREPDEIRDDPQGWAIGRGVDPRNVVDHTRNA